MPTRVLVSGLVLCCGCIVKQPNTDDGNALDSGTDSPETEQSMDDSNSDTGTESNSHENEHSSTDSESDLSPTATETATDDIGESSGETLGSNDSAKTSTLDDSNTENATANDESTTEASSDSSESDESAESSTGEELECGDLEITVRDFKDAHPDFEVYSGTMAYTGIVSADIGLDRKPVYAHSGSTPQTSGPSEFSQWYNDDGSNHPITVTIRLDEVSPGRFIYDNSAFFPADDQGWGNEGRDHNFHFTTEMHTEFKYEGGEEFTFTGDDDLWLFINGKLAIDLGGLHPPLSATILLDDLADDLEIEIGNTYAFEIFHAERHTTGSNFRIETTIDCFIPPPPG